MKEFFKETWAIIGYVVGLAGAFVTILTVSGHISIDYRWLILIGIVLLSSVVISVLATFRLSKVVQNGTRFEITAYGEEKEKDVYYTRYSNNLRVGTVVAIYYSKPFSKKIGFGVVQNISVDEYIEIKVLHVEEEFSDIFMQSKTNNRNVLDDMYILPNTYVDELQMIIKELKGGDA